MDIDDLRGSVLTGDAAYLAISDRERLTDHHQRVKAARAARLGDARPGARVADVGAGQGWHTAALAAGGWDAVGVEPSGTLRAAAVRRWGPGAPVLAGRAEDLPLRDRSADLVVALNTVLGYGEPDDNDRALDEARRVLRPGAAAVIELLAPDPDGDTHGARRFPDGAVLERHRLHAPAGVRRERETLTLPDGTRAEVTFRARVIDPSDILASARRAGLRRARVAGDMDAGPWREGGSTVLVARAPI